MKRILNALFYSFAGLRHGFFHEEAIRQELIVLALAVPVGFLLATTWWVYLALIGSLLIVLAVELLNTAIERLSDHVMPDLHPQIKIVKDLASAAVFCVLLLAAAIWTTAVLDRLF
jgi:diacylglycerol kinase (ATP)